LKKLVFTLFFDNKMEHLNMRPSVFSTHSALHIDFPHHAPAKPCSCSCPEKGERLPTKCGAEFIGTFILVQTICLAANSRAAGGAPAIPIGFVLTALVYQMGHISGAQFNPAVSLGVWIAGGQDFFTTLAYWGSQILGGVLSGLVASYVVELPTEDPSSRMFPSIDVKNRQGAWTEFLFTFFLVSTVLNVAVSKSQAYNGNNFFGIAIGFALMAGVAAGGAFSGGAYNPAVVMGVNTGYHMFTKHVVIQPTDPTPMGNEEGAYFANWFAAIGMELLGGLVAGAWFLWTDRAPEDKGDGDLAKPSSRSQAAKKVECVTQISNLEKEIMKQADLKKDQA